MPSARNKGKKKVSEQRAPVIFLIDTTICPEGEQIEGERKVADGRERPGKKTRKSGPS